jgi:hypothetical protein
MVRLAVVPWSVFLAEVQAAPNSYMGSGPLGPCRVRGRQPMSQAAPQKPLRAARRLIKAAGSIPSRGNSLRPDDHLGIETQCVSRSAWSHTVRTTRIGATGSRAASSQLVLGSSCGPPKRAMVQCVRMSVRMHRSTARGPIQKQWGQGEELLRDAAGQRDCSASSPTPSRPLRAFTLACPS